MPLSTYTCTDCAKTFTTNKGLQSHCSAKKHGNNQPRPAVQMSTVFVAASRPETGMFGTWGMSTMTTGEGDKGVSPRSPNAPAVSTPTPQTQYPWRCDKCELSFKSKKELDAHMKKSLVHLRCGRCVQGFADEATLQLVRTHSFALSYGMLTESLAYSYHPLSI